MIFEPGFTTSEEINDVSGRGVGMDVVRRNVEALHGSIAIDSDGGGTTVTMKLPLTLAIIEAFGVSVGEEHYLIPQHVVIECMQLANDAAGEVPMQGVIDVRGDAVPFLRLGRFFGVDSRPQRENVVLVQCGELRAGLAVDQLHGGAQVVVKPMGDFFRGVRGISGSAILGSGRVALILDVPVLLDQIMEEAFA
jgi:two-component system chemotaxis sensor kinase CheA